MFYQWPEITHLDQVREAISSRDEFIIAEREWGFVVNYLVNLIDTFPAPNTKDDRLNRLYSIRRECRGIKFALDESILARPFSKFFNLGEKPEVFEKAVDWSQDFVILDKLDGSMIHPIIIDGKVTYCTKMGPTDIAAEVQSFANKKGHKAIFYNDFCYDLFKSGMTPIFEWCSRKQRIIIDYPNDRLVLTAIRDIVTGTYKTYDQMEALAIPYRVPVVGHWEGDWSGIGSFSQTVKERRDEEGYVIRFKSGHMLKIKNLWYLQLHKTKELLTFEKDVWALVIDEKHDDAKAFMEDPDKARIDSFADALYKNLDETVDRLKWIVIAAQDNLNGSKKRFAIEVVNDHNPRNERPLLFKMWDGGDPRDIVYTYVRSQLSSGTKLEEIRNLGGNIRWEDF